jgi:hypothetical protein
MLLRVDSKGERVERQGDGLRISENWSEAGLAEGKRDEGEGGTAGRADQR